MDLGYIDVYEDKETLSFKIVPPKDSERKLSLTTGLHGFFGLLDSEGGYVYKVLPVVYNGFMLDEEQTKEFWYKTEKMKSN
jgi:hypothetical protein